jgi:hypothetical protein
MVLGVLPILIGLLLHIRATSGLVADLHWGGRTFVLVSLGWQQQLAEGVYLAVGGAVLFALGIALSMYREKLLQLPEQIAKREGVFRILNWR